ncbi:MTR10 [[Candida] subhashii]|uniref:MTR10 n=1 Tax=[Candida] subhashii TaxID=561895 RepID=A0A8J5QT27_9ASCO|nr:MTR10 [[Candida] subhashii]KAG7665858.1 MTR10 [[Candida] subhashii]
MASTNETLTRLNHALDTMYTNAAQQEKVQATQFLEAFQKSQEAWEIVHIILNDDNLTNIQIKLFASQTLRSKITYDLLQLPESNYEQLKNSILDIIVKYSLPNQKLIRTQLSVALSQLALQYLSWTNAFSEIVNKLSSNQSLLPVLLEFLKILPEELSDVKKTNLSDEEFNQRTQNLISDNVEQVLLILKNLTDSSQGGDSLLSSSILDCLNSWIKECPIESVLQISSLTALVFQSLSNDQTFDKAIECLCTIIRETRDIENDELIDALYQQILQLNKFMQEHPDKLEDPETIDGLTRLYVECGEAWHVLIAKNPKHFKPLVQILLHSCKYEDDLDVVKYTFYFWYLLKQLLTMDKFQESKAEFRDIYAELITIIIKHLTYPITGNDDDLFNGDKEQEDKFKEFRYEMGDVLKDCCAIVGPTIGLSIPFQQIQTLLSNASTTSYQWQHLEAPLFSMRTMAKEIPTKEKTMLPTIMSYLVQLPEHPKIRYAATLVLGRYTEWTAKNPEFLEPQLDYIIKGFEPASTASASGTSTPVPRGSVPPGSADSKAKNDIAIAASRALMYFCQDCSELLVNYLEQLYMLYGQVKDRLDLESHYELADGLAHVISKVPEENMYKTTEMFLAPTLELLRKLSESGAGNEKLIADQVEVITIFIQVLKSPDFEKPSYPVADLFMDKIWPVVCQLLNNFGSTLIVSERIQKLIKAGVQSFSTYLNRILPDLANLLVQGFKTTNFGCYLWVSGVVIREFGDEYSTAEVKEAVYQFGLQQCFTFFEILQGKNEEQLKQLPDVIEDFFRMMNDLLMFYPHKLLHNFELLNSTLNSAQLTLSIINEFEPIISCVHFLIDLVSWGLPHPPISLFEDNPEPLKQSMQQFVMLDNHGGELLRVVLNGIIFRFHNDVQQDANDLMLKILRVVPDTNLPVTWLSEVVNSLPNIQKKETDRLLNTVSVALPNKDNRRVRSALRDFVSWYSRKNVSPRSEF